MRALRIALLLSTAMLIWIQSSAQSDSAAYYPVQKYKLWKLIDAYQILPYCEGTVQRQESALKKADSLLVLADRRIVLKDSTVVTLQNQLAEARNLSRIELADEKIKTAKVKKSLLVVTAIAVVELIILLAQ